MKSISVDTDGFDLLDVLAKLERNPEAILLFRNNKPVAPLTPLQAIPKDRLTPHPEMSRIQIHHDPTGTMDETEWPGSF
jgi:antitoxin (DNA-binding transcriptional repressor) of toxin-antitoxin stability system